MCVQESKGRKRFQPRVAVEVKKSVSATVQSVDPHHMCQAAVECLYIMKNYSVQKLILVLTDGITYHVFVVLYNEGLPALTMVSGQTIVNELGKTISLLATLLVAISPVPEL